MAEIDLARIRAGAAVPELACPTCQQHLHTSDDGKLRCHACAIDYPCLDDVPFCWPDPQANLADWRMRFNRTLAELEDRQRQADAVSEPVSERLQALRNGLRTQQIHLSKLLTPLTTGPGLARETHIALGTQLPAHHDLLSYDQNIFRDWSWGEAENKATADCVLKLLHQHSVEPVRSMLVLGAGAGRLAYDLHGALATQQSWALDSNPLLCLIAAKMVRGASCEMTEIPVAPVHATDCAVTRRLSAPAPVPDLKILCADALNPPFAPNQFDLVVTPWLIDVIDSGLSEFVNIIATLLTPGGVWLNHGSAAFTGSPANQLTTEDVQAISQAAGFDVVAAADTWLPYLQSPSSRHHRQELTYTQLARLSVNAEPAVRTEHAHVPRWLQDPAQAVPLSEPFRSQILATRIHAYIMSLIDGKRSINDMAAQLESERLMPREDARHAITRFLQKMHDEARAASGPEHREESD